MTDYQGENDPTFYYSFEGLENDGHISFSGQLDTDDGIRPDAMVDPDFISDEIADESRLVNTDEWPIFALSELPADRESQLEPYQVVQGVRSLNDFSRIEEHIVSTVTPAKHNSPAHAIALEPEIITRHIGDVLRPRVGARNFYGTLLQGQVLLLPFDAGHAIEQQPWLTKKALSPERLEKHPPSGLTVIYNGIFRSSRAGELGEFAVKTTYFNKKSHLQYTRKDGDDYVHRTVGNTDDIREISYALDANALESAQNALKITQRSLALRLGHFRPWDPVQRRYR